jgi:hypothetical protein
MVRATWRGGGLIPWFSENGVMGNYSWQPELSWVKTAFCLDV